MNDIARLWSAQMKLWQLGYALTEEMIADATLDAALQDVSIAIALAPVAENAVLQVEALIAEEAQRSRLAAEAEGSNHGWIA